MKILFTQHFVVNYQQYCFRHHKKKLKLVKVKILIRINILFRMKSLFIFALCVGITLGMPQRFPAQQLPDDNSFVFPINNNENSNRVSSTTSSPPAATVTTASPQFLACLQACPSTMEYNPICGTDNQNYHNSGRLSCAQRCGKTVAAVRSGICNS